MKGKQKLSILLAASLVMSFAAVPAYASNIGSSLSEKTSPDSFQLPAGPDDGEGNEQSGNGEGIEHTKVTTGENEQSTTEATGTTGESGSSEQTSASAGENKSVEEQKKEEVKEEVKEEPVVAEESKPFIKKDKAYTSVAGKSEPSKEEIANEQKNEAGDSNTNEAEDRNSRVMSNGDKNTKEETVGLDKYHTSGSLAKANLPNGSNTPNTGDSEGLYASGIMLVLANLGLLATALKRKITNEK